MANIKITDLTAYTNPRNTDVLPIVDVTSDTTKKVSIADLLKNASAGTAAAPGIAFDGDSNTGIYSPGADQLAISTGGTGRLFVDADGNVGVGVNSPAADLHIYSSIQTRLRLEDQGEYLDIVYNDNSNTLSVGIINADNSNTSVADTELRIGVDGINRYVIKADGSHTFYKANGNTESLSIAGDGSVYFAGPIASLGSYNDTTASAANVFIASNGDIQRSTSSIRYKTNVETLEQSYADNIIFNARPVWYRSLCEADNASWSYYGLIAEEIAELDPRLVFWGRPTKEVLREEAKDAVLDDEGNVIEPATEAVYINVEDTDAELRPEGVQYDRLTVMLIDVVQRQQKAIEALEAKVAALEA